jgi:pyridoxamine 5'-phosphate oxidase
MLSADILATFRDLLEQARASIDPEPNAMNVATADADGRISSRIVLLKGVDERGLRFFTNVESAKGEQLRAHPQVAVCFHWKHLAHGIQVRFEGSSSRLPDADADAYFATRPHGSQIGAWASAQSQTLPDRNTFEQRVAKYEKEFDGRDVPRPPHWGGYLISPHSVEFWYGAEFRLHERVRWDRFGETWRSRLLYP